MSTTNKLAFAGSTSITITLTSLGASATAGRQSTVIDNSTNLYLDVMCTVVVKNSSSTIGSSKTWGVYISASEDGTNYDQDDGVMGASDAAYTINSPTNLKRAAVINAPTASKVYNATFNLLSVCGFMPRKWILVVINDTNQTGDASIGSATYTGITSTNG